MPSNASQHGGLRAFILAAGLGERLRPITNFIPKPLLPILGKPLIELILDRINALPVEAVAMNVYHGKGCFERWLDASGYGDRLTVFPEDSILDTGGGLKNAESFFACRTFLVHNGDILTDLDLAALVRHHRASGNLVTLATHDHAAHNNVTVDQRGQVLKVGIGSAPPGADANFQDLTPRTKMVAFTGVAVYEPDFLPFLPRGASSVVPAWLRAAQAGAAVGTFDVTGCTWNDIGTPSSYATAVRTVLAGRGETVFMHPLALGCSDAALDGIVVCEGNTRLNNASLRDCIVLTGATLEPRQYEECIVGPGFELPVAASSFGDRVEGKGRLIGTGGSDRRYYRTQTTAGTEVLMECAGSDPDFDRHIEYTRFLSAQHIPVPRLLDLDPDRKTARFEDLGDLSLYSWMQCKRSTDTVETMYRSVLDILITLHGETSGHVADCPLLMQRIFDYDYLRWETSYFLDRYVKGVRHTEPDQPSALDEEFHRLAALVDAFPKRIIHRDFQSQNLMIRDGMPRVIDFQGARMAPPAYDVASILWDPYVRIENVMRDSLLYYYIDAMEQRAGAWFEAMDFVQSLAHCRLQRHMQALGAYGFLAEVKGKTYFTKHIPEALRVLKEDVIFTREQYPALFELVQNL